MHRHRVLHACMLAERAIFCERRVAVSRMSMRMRFVQAPHQCSGVRVTVSCVYSPGAMSVGHYSRYAPVTHHPRFTADARVCKRASRRAAAPLDAAPNTR